MVITIMIIILSKFYDGMNNTGTFTIVLEDGTIEYMIDIG
jgi:hypothetical protein